MSRGTATRTAAQEILLGALDLSKSGKETFSEWDLTVATWQRNPNRFGCRGYEDLYPDHKRVMMEVMAQKKPDNPVRRGFFVKAHPNYYSLTALGRAEATRILGSTGSLGETTRSPGPAFLAVEPYVKNRVFQAWLRDESEPKTWLGASAFLGIKRNTPNELNDTIRQVRVAAELALGWCKENGKETLTRGTHGGGAISRTDLRKILEFVKVLETRFAMQIDAIRRKDV